MLLKETQKTKNTPRENERADGRTHLQRSERAQPLGRISRQQTADDTRRGRRHVLGDHEGRPPQALEELLPVLRVPRGKARQHLVHEHAEPPPVHRRAVPSLVDHLGSVWGGGGGYNVNACRLEWTEQ